MESMEPRVLLSGDLGPLTVTQFQATATGFTAKFNQPIDSTVLNLYDTEAGALALVQTGLPDAVLMDIRLGRKDSGLHAARRIRESCDVPIVFCTAYADSEPVQAKVRAIENAHLVGKPMDEEQLEWLLRGIETHGAEIPTLAPLELRGGFVAPKGHL
jgi:CheY-like chemotaxis protein